MCTYEPLERCKWLLCLAHLFQIRRAVVIVAIVVVFDVYHHHPYHCFYWKFTSIFHFLTLTFTHVFYFSCENLLSNGSWINNSNKHERKNRQFPVADVDVTIAVVVVVVFCCWCDVHNILHRRHVCDYYFVLFSLHIYTSF